MVDGMIFSRKKFKDDDIVQYMIDGKMIYMKIISVNVFDYAYYHISEINMKYTPLDGWDVYVEMNLEIGPSSVSKKFMHKYGKLMKRFS